MGEQRVRRILGALLMLYPPAFRWELGDDLAETALHRWRDAKQHGGRVGALRFWLTDGLRFVIDGVLERLRSLWSPVEDFAQSWKQLLRAPGHYALAVLTLALGIAATTTIFTVADAVVFRPLPYTDADRLYLIHPRFGDLELSSNSLPNLQDLQASVRTMSWFAGATDNSPALTDAAAAPERVSALTVTQQYLTRLGARTEFGRAFAAEDHAMNAARVVIVSYPLWQRRWGGDRGVLGRTVELNGVAHTIIGVMQRTFRDPEPIESGVITGAWTPARAVDTSPGCRARCGNRDDFGYRVVGRLSDAATLDVARQELAAAGARLSEAYPDVNRIDGKSMDFLLHPLREATVGEARARLLLLLGAVVLLLLLSCANVANLFVAHGVTRASELAMRTALGGTRARVAFQLMSESFVTAVVAGVMGGILSAFGLRLFVAFAPGGTPRLHEIGLNQHALWFIVLLTVVTAVIFGTFPALRGARVAVASTPGARSTPSRSTQRFQSALVGVEVAISLVLVAGAALLLNSFRHLLNVEPGFDADAVTVVDIRPPTSGQNHADDVLFYSSVLERARTMPGVQQAGLMHTTPGIRGGAWSPMTSDEEANAAQASQRPTAPSYGAAPSREFLRLNPVHGDAFEALGMQLVAGRLFEGEPGPGDPLVAVINQTAAQRLFPGVDRPIGRRLKMGPPQEAAPMREVIGIVADVRQQGASRAADPQVYLPYAQRDIPRMLLVLKTHSSAVVTREMMSNVVREVARDVPVDGLDLLSTNYAATAEQTRFLTFLLSVFAGIGLLLAVVGTYATATHAMTRRVRELGIRIALGASYRSVLRLVLSRALLIIGVGTVMGIGVTLMLTRFLEGYVFGITARDPLTFAMAVAVIGASATLASLVPAVRAARVDPNDVLRAD